MEKIEDSGQKGETSEGILAVRGGRGSVNVDNEELGKPGRRSSENLNQNRFCEKLGKRRLSENWSENRKSVLSILQFLMYFQFLSSIFPPPLTFLEFNNGMK